jgi:hypothetical protein
MRLTSEKQIPSKIQACARAHSLGVPRIMYEPHAYSRLYLVLGPFALLVSALIFGGYRYYYEQFFRWGPEWQITLILSISVAWLIIGLWILLTPVFSPRTRVFLCPKGLIYDKRGLEVIRWDRIALIHKELHVDASSALLRNYTLRREDGKLFVLTSDLPYLERLGGFMEREIVRHLLPRAISMYMDGQVQFFADVQVTRQGIAIKDNPQLLAWPDFERIVLDETTCSIYRTSSRQAWMTLSLSGMPNVWVLQGLAEHIMKHSMRVPMVEEKMVAANPAPEIFPRSSQIVAYDAGFSVHFGKLCINREGININDGEVVVPWEDIASLGVSNDELILRRIGAIDQWYTLPLWTISDVAALRQLIDYIFFKQYQ